VEPIAFTPLGYAANQLGNRRRKTMMEIVKHERWQD
jgi:hypothetical protein